MKTDKEIILLIALGLFLNLWAINWGLPNVNDWTNLSLAPLKPLSYAKSLLTQEAWFYHYPPFHFILLAVIYSPYVLFLVLTDGISSPTDIYPYGLTNPELSLTIFILISRFVSVAMGVGVVIINYVAVKKFYNRTAAFVTAFLIVTSYPIIHYSHSANVDVPQLFWFSLGLYSYISLIYEPKAKYYIMLGLFAAFAFATKNSIYAAFIGIAVVILCVNFIRKYESNKNLLSAAANTIDLNILYGLIIVVVATLLIFNPITNWEGFMFHIDRHSLRSVRGSWVIRDAPSKIQGHIELIYHYMVYIFQSNGPLVFVLLMGGIIYCLIKNPWQSSIIFVPIVSYYIFFLRIHGTHHLRYMLPIYIPLLWFAGKLSSDLFSVRSRFKVLWIILITLILLHSLFYGASVNILYVNDPRYHAEEWINQNIPDRSIILAIDPEYSLPRLPRNQIILQRDLWDFHGNVIDDIKDIDADYVVLGASIPRRRQRKQEVDKLFRENGFAEVASFGGAFPFWTVEIPNLHILNPRITILQKVR
jgi:4-amino-4-deoxy-L-arabinose transferase-like glycosyltransferase